MIPTPQPIRYHALWDSGGSPMEFTSNGRFVLKHNGNGGAWEEWEDGLRLQPEAGGELYLERDAEGYACQGLTLMPCAGEFTGFWQDFDPRHPLYQPLTRCPWRMTSTYGALKIPNGETWDAVVSGENATMRDEGDRLRWEFGGRWGYARRFVGTPAVSSPRALLVPHFYDYWGRLKDWRPDRLKPEAGLSFLASNLGRPGSLAARRLDVVRELSRWFTVAIPGRLAGLFPPGAKLAIRDVPRTPQAKFEFVSGFTFHLCFENSTAPGYLTEKPFHALVSGAVPVYEGDPQVGQWLDASALVDCSGLDATEIADRIRQAEKDGLPEKVHALREDLILVSLEEMVRRVETFCRASADGGE